MLWQRLGTPRGPDRIAILFWVCKGAREGALVGVSDGRLADQNIIVQGEGTLLSAPQTMRLDNGTRRSEESTC